MQNLEIPVKRLNARLEGADAVAYEVLEATLQMSRSGLTKSEKDSALMILAFDSLQIVLKRMKEETGINYPSFKQIKDYIQNSGQ